MNNIPRWSDVHIKGASPHAQAMLAWLRQPQQQLGPSWQAPFVKGFVELLTQATLEDCVYVGFEFDPVRRPLLGTLIENDHLMKIEFSPVLAHRGVSISHNDWEGAWIWVNGVALAIPCDSNGWPQADQYTTGWCGDDRFFFVQIGGLARHPLYDHDEYQRLGNVRGLLIHDVETRQQRIEYPDESQLWSSPWLAVKAHAFHIYAAQDEEGAGVPARVVPIGAG
jgi:hypothetical protein